MARAYGKRQSVRRQGGASKQVLLVFISFLLGYMGSSVLDVNQLGAWISAQWASSGKKTPSPVVARADLPKPKFEFYTLLAKESRVTSLQEGSAAAPPSAVVPVVPPPLAAQLKTTPPLVAVVAAKPVIVPIAPVKGAYLVQVAAFKRQQDAEKLKAALSLKGFSVHVTAFNQQHSTWYRVSMGPFASRPLAVKMQGAVARSEHIVGMIRKMDA